MVSNSCGLPAQFNCPFRSATPPLSTSGCPKRLKVLPILELDSDTLKSVFGFLVQLCQLPCTSKMLSSLLILSFCMTQSSPFSNAFRLSTPSFLPPTSKLSATISSAGYSCACFLKSSFLASSFLKSFLISFLVSMFAVVLIAFGTVKFLNRAIILPEL